MSSGYATPIRLILDDDEKTAIRLDATRIGMSVERKTGGNPIPFTGGRRIGLDLNLTNSVIVIDGVFVDDDRVRSSSTPAVSATAEIDFGIAKNEVFAVDAPSVQVMTGNGFAQPATYTLTDKTGATVITFSIEDFADNGTGGGVTFGANASSYLQVGGSSGTTWKIRGGQGAGTFTTNANVAAAINHLMANQSIGGVALTTKFTTALADSSNTSRTAGNNEKVVFTAASGLAGEYGADGVIQSTNTIGTTKSLTTFFGADAAPAQRKSAGDKVQDLYGILHNTIRGGSAKVGGAVGDLGTLGVPLLFNLGKALGDGAGGDFTFRTATQQYRKSGDYPIGLQIPYNSTIQAPDGQLYTARNFFIPTGRRMKGEKGSEANDLSADVEFSTTDNYTGIQGTVKNLEIGYDAGEAVYRFTLTFLPVDIIF